MNIFHLSQTKSSTTNRKGVDKARSLLLLLVLYLFTIQASSQVAPVNPPTGGFAIDGGLRANTPTSPSPFAPNQGDWYPTINGSGSSVFLNTNNTPINTATSGRATPPDPFNTNTDGIFTTGSKFNDFISALRWTSGSAPDKNDINNALYHVSRDLSNNQWAFIAGDRLSTNGTSYIDFEFLQGTVTKNANGTFTGTPLTGTTSSGAQIRSGGGRTENDIIISMEYTNGGSKPNVIIYQWKQVNGVWQFQQLNLPNLAANAFAETNRGGPEPDLPYSAFGATQYQQYAFVEAAVNITALLSQSGLACAGLKINTLWVKTKASASSTAALKDFVDPIPVNLDFGSISITQAGPFCVNNTTPQTLEVTGIANLTGTFSGNGIVNNKFVPSVAGVGTHTINFTSADGSCTKTTSITVNGLPTALAGNDPVAQCLSTTGNTFNLGGVVTNGTASWTIVSKTNDNINVLIGNTSAANTTATLTGAAGSVTLRLTSTSSFTPSCGTATDDITLTVNPNPTAAAGNTPDAQCFSSTGNIFNLGGTVTNGTASWSVVSKSNQALAVAFGDPASATTTATVTGGSGTVTLRLTSTSNTIPSCGADAKDIVLTVNANPTAAAGSTPAAQCQDPQGNTFSLNGTVTNGTPSWSVVSKSNDALTVSFSASGSAATDVTVSGGSGTVTLRLTTTSNTTPSCGTANSEVTVTVNPNPTANAGTTPAAQCFIANGNVFNLSGSVTNGTPSWSIVNKSDAALNVAFGNANAAVTTATITGGSGTVTLRLTSTSNANPVCDAATSDVTLTVNPNPTSDAGSAPTAQCFIANGNIFSLSGTVTNGTPSWSVVNKSNEALNVVFSAANNSSTNVTITGGDGATQSTVTLRLTSTSGFTPSCGTATDDIIVTINPKAPAPSAEVLKPDCDDATMSVKVLNPVAGVTYKLSQPSINSAEQTITAVATQSNSDDPSVASDVIFTGLTFGKGYRLIAVNQSGCESQPDLCGPQSATVTQQANNQLSQAVGRTQTIKLEGGKTQVQAAPNPFREKVRFQLESAVSGYGSLEIFNAQGQRIGIAFQGFVEKGRTQTIEYTAPAQQQGALIYQFRVGDQRVSGKLLNLK